MLTQEADGDVQVDNPPATLTDRQVLVLDVEGSLFFAGARTQAAKLPSPDAAIELVVILRLRGYTPAGSTLIDVLDDYAQRLSVVGGALYLSGVGEDLSNQLRRSGKLDLGGGVHLFTPRPIWAPRPMTPSGPHWSAWLGLNHRLEPFLRRGHFVIPARAEEHRELRAAVYRV